MRGGALTIALLGHAAAFAPPCAQRRAARPAAITMVGPAATLAVCGGATLASASASLVVRGRRRLLARVARAEAEAEASGARRELEAAACERRVGALTEELDAERAFVREL